MLTTFTSIFGWLQPILIFSLSIIILALFAIMVILIREIQQLRSSQRLSPVTHTNFVEQFPESAHKEIEADASTQREWSETSFTPHLTHSDINDSLSDKHWLKLVEECVDLFDDLDRHFASFDPARQELAEHMLLQLQEILERSEVEIITGDTIFERRLHQSEQADTDAISGAYIVETLRPGFIVGHRVLRRARVRVASNLS
jgi:molecular chaperone GrpE (heat shock protein)